LTITDTAVGATIYYTTNGTTPSSSTTPYTEPITISASETIKAIAVLSGYSSAATSAIYTLQAPQTLFSPAAGAIVAGSTVSLSDACANAAFYYTTNGKAPTTRSTKYSVPITVSSPETIEAIAVCTGYITGKVASAAYTLQAATPVISPPSGTYSTVQTVTISDATSGAQIFYTTDGTTPTTSSAQYAGSITVNTSETVNAIAVASGFSTSAIASAVYLLEPPAPAPTFSIPNGIYAAGQQVTLKDSLPGTIYYTTNGITPSTASTIYAGAITLTATTAIQAIEVAPGFANSVVAVGVFSIAPRAATPTIIPGTGPEFAPLTVTILDANPGATIYYTTDSSIPTTSSTQYTGPFTIGSIGSTVVRAIATAPGFALSNYATASYAISQPPQPPEVLNTSASSVTPSGATLIATVLDNDIAGCVWFNYGTSPTALSSRSATYMIPARQGLPVVASQPINWLEANTTYYVQAWVQTTGGTVSGPIVSFTTTAAP
jgi:hypothetical protein